MPVNTPVIPVAAPDQWLLEQVKEGNTTAFETLFHRYHALLVNIAAGYLGRVEDAEEIVQDLFLQLWHNRQQLAIRGNAKYYLAVSVKNRCLNELKKHHRTLRTRLDSVTFDPGFREEIKMESREAQVAIEQAIAALPEQCRLVFHLSRKEEMSYREISEVLSISVKTVENHMGRALKTVRTLLQQYFEYLSIGTLLAIKILS